MNSKKIIVNIGAFALLGLIAGTAVYYNFTPSKDTPEPKSETSAADAADKPVIVALTDEQMQKMDLEIRTAAPGQLNMLISTRGKIIPHPDGLVHVIPKAPGTVREAKKNVGDAVATGESLAVLESQEMALLKAEFLATSNKEKLASTIHEREKSLHQKQVTSEQDYFNAAAGYEEAKINTQLARQKLYSFGLCDKEIHSLSNQKEPDFRFYSICAPIDGVVTHRHLTKGEYVENTATIFEIADFSTLWIDIAVYPKDLSKIKQGQMVEVILPGEKASSQARIVFIRPIIEGETITAQAFAELDNPSGVWYTGSFVKILITTDTVPAQLIVSKDAVQNIDGQDCVFLCAGGGFEKRIVKVGQSDNENTEILAGLQPGDRYANRSFLLKAELGKNSVEDDD